MINGQTKLDKAKSMKRDLMIFQTESKAVLLEKLKGGQGSDPVKFRVLSITMISMKKLGFSCHPGAKVRCKGPPGN